MSHLPFARKYRPQTFEDLVGQPHVTTTLTRALAQKRLGQAYLFTGLRGVGKTSAARILAKALTCEQGPAPTPCNRCTACTQITKGNSLDVIEIDGASNRGVDEIRGIHETVAFAPTSGPFRIYIIDEVHMLTTEAFNALLKTLEEPPAHVKFIFATTAPNKVPATILSRCQRFDFRRIEAGPMVEALRKIAQAEHLAVDEAALYAITRTSDGSMRDAEVVLEQLSSFVEGTIAEAHVTELLGAVGSEPLFALMAAIFRRDAAEALAVITAQRDLGKEPAQLLEGLLRHVRNLAILASTREAAARETLIGRLIDEPEERLSRLDAQAAETSLPSLLVFLQILSGAYELVRRSPMAQTILELVVLKLATREEWQSLEEITRRLEQLQAGEPAAPGSQPPAASARPPAAGSAPSSKREPIEAPARAQAVAAAPTPDVAPAAGGVPEQLNALWPTFLERLGTQKMSLAAYLANSRPLRLSGQTLTIGLPGFVLHQEVLSTVDNRRLIERLLAEVAGHALTIQYGTLPDDASAEAAGPDAVPEDTPVVVQDIVKLFNATVLNRPTQPAS